MSDGYLRWFRPQLTLRCAEQLLADLAEHGMHLARRAPQDPMARARSAARLAQRAQRRGADIVLQFWVDEQSDVLAAVQHLPDGLTAVEFSLDGLTAEQEQQVISALEQARGAGDRIHGWILDYSGRADDVDWNEVIRGAEVRIATAPHELALPAAFLALHPELDTLPRATWRDLAIFRWQRPVP